MRRRLWSSIDKYKGRASNRGGGQSRGAPFPQRLRESINLAGSSGCREPVEGIVEYPSTELGFK